MSSEAPGDLPVSEAATRPLLRVLRGDPTAEELAALVAVVAARGAAAAAAAATQRPRPRRTWGDPALAVRAPLSPGLGAWRRSALPR